MLSLQLPPCRAVIDTLGLEPNPQGGWCGHVPGETVADDVGPRVVTYLLAVDAPVTFFHRTQGDCMYYFHQGCPLVVLTISPEGVLTRRTLGSDLGSGQQFQCAVPAVWWRAFELIGEPWGLMSSAVGSSGEPAEPELATGEAVQRDAPDAWPEIERFVAA
jgi:uncharacterized protein